MIILYLVAVIFILLILIINKKEYFTAQCTYVPWGPTFDSYVSNCQSKSRIGLWDQTGNFCNEDICREKCLKCDHERCEWLSMWDKKQLKKESEQMMKENENHLVPKKLNISGISYLDKFTLSWNNNNDANKIMIHIINLSNPTNKIDVSTVNAIETSKEISGLEENNEYSVTAYALNKFGISNPSNTIVIKLN